MYAAGKKDMQKMDEYTMRELGLPGIVLMENAGAKVVEEIVTNAPCAKPRVIILAGGGNNGGDGFVIARRLADLGWNLLLCLLVNPERIKGDAKVHYEAYAKRNLPIFYLEGPNIKLLQAELGQADIIVDAILGTGVNGPVKQQFNQVISMVNEYSGRKLIISVDIPSGLNSDTGEASGTAIKADRTVTFVFPKKGFFLQDGPMHVGEWKAVDISVPPSSAKELGLDMPKIITDSMVSDFIPKRPQNGHKGTFGHVLILGGSRQFVGAPIFSAKAALHSGAGLVTLAVPECIYPMAAAQNPESLLMPLKDEDGHFSTKAISELIPALPQFDSIAIGPGMGRFSGGGELLRTLLGSLTHQSIVVDADALYLLKDDLALIRDYQGNVIFTPHPGEMARLIGKSVHEVEADRLETAIEFAGTYNVYLLLKGHRSIIASPDGSVYINPHGHDALGKGGSGDVLTGLAASFLAQGSAPLKALIGASFLHAKAGEAKAEVLSHYGVMPSDIIDGVKGLLHSQVK
ncbi:bifunctional ADP-dependent NAD(P)H-hydrate dehydratase/NAD(P)H-hydrate epimerase [Neobacillus dielmonensis]|uniref:bifunctional ADP-dependent NAD(P)H-hydrate dehydratase/NAD(P)H-hydrate epimerase n=1 Tax=Neobacillus dielmonensis TaxID=1347369 RepID=UPI0005AA8BE1|nr:bifunctional ADP-dependent NAD(P)H-hydrate dehydratase/NAD(P)H-hydrate epimerase [Neobacillus dielmonensis]